VSGTWHWVATYNGDANNNVAPSGPLDEPVTVSEEADLAVTVTVNDPTPNVGETVTFTVGLANLGPDTATNVTLSDPLPPGLTFVSDTPSQGSYNPTTGVWTVGTVTTTTPLTLMVAAIVNSPAPQTYTWTVSHSDQFDPNLANNTASATVTPQQSDLVLTKTSTDATPNVGDVITYIVVLTNKGPDTATGVAVTDMLPAGLAFVAAMPTAGTYDSATGVWTVGTVTTTSPQFLAIQARVVSGTPQTNTATISAVDQFDPDPSNNTASAPETPAVADLGVTKVVNPTEADFGFNVTYTVTVNNNGPNPATDVMALDPVPAGLTFVSAAPSQGTYDPASGVWMIGTLANGAEAVLQVTVTVEVIGSVINTAEVTALQFDPDLSNNTASATVIGENPSPTITKREFLASTDPTDPPTGTDPAAPMPSVTTLQGDIAYINNLYQDLLGRPADAAGLSYWMSTLMTTGSQSAVAQGIWDSPEHLGIEVNQLYETLLHRTADPTGQTYWVNQLLAGESEADVEAGILSSAEFQADYPNNTAFLGAVYQDVLGRPLDPAGQAYWLGQLQNGTSRAQVADGILGSQEAMADTIEGYYADYLGRAADPAGLQYYLNQLLAGGPGQEEAVAVQIMTSQEFFNDPATDPPALPTASALLGDNAYINGLYQDLLGRNVDAAGLAYWMNVLVATGSRAQVAQGIWNSPEHLGIEVNQLYETLLHRPADPTGQTYWVNQLLAGASEPNVEAGILSSAEFQADYPSNVSFLDTVYEDVLDRPLDAAGQAYWLGQLQDGATREEVIDGILSSQEALTKVLQSDYLTYLGRALDPTGQQYYLSQLQAGGPSLEDDVAVQILASQEFFNDKAGA
jgi:uncharacterized repeat protein (TIGR01451 family)